MSRFEWEQIIRRARLAGLIGGSNKYGKDGKSTRGGVSGGAFKAVLLTWATYAAPDGSSIHPGDATLAVESEVGLKQVKLIKAMMIELGLTERTHAGSRRLRQPDIYRLTLPPDLLDHVEVLSPAAVKVAAVHLYEKQRGKRGGSTGPLKDPIPGDGVGDPPDPPQDDPLEIVGGPSDHQNDVVGGPSDQLWGVQWSAIPNQDLTKLLPDQGDGAVSAAVTGPRADPPEAEMISNLVGSSATPRRCEHGLPGGLRPDGRPTCALCRVAESRPAMRAAPTPASLARVIQMRPTG